MLGSRPGHDQSHFAVSHRGALARRGIIALERAAPYPGFMASPNRELKVHQRVVHTSPVAGPERARHPEVGAPLPATEVRGQVSTSSALGLQRRAGNRATAALLGAGQAKLVVGAAGDRYEQEADAVAAQVLSRLRSGATATTASTATTGGGPVERVGADGDKQEDGPLARKLSTVARTPLGRTGNLTDKPDEAGPMGAAGGELDNATEASIEAARRGGSPLPEGVRRQMEGAFGADFSPVKLHKGEKAEDLNQRVGAVAFTVGRDIFLGRSAPAVSSPAGQELVAHELAHVVQQGGARSRPETGEQPQ